MKYRLYLENEGDPVLGRSILEKSDPRNREQLVLDPVAFIDETSRNKISSFCGTIARNGHYKARVYQGNRSLAAHVTADYHGRFLSELIQNANDAHPSERHDGQVRILLAEDELPFGTLYVANRGKAFTTENVDALCDMGMSSKSPGESIGNKGLGFRSVHHISDEPEIYSQLAPYGAKDEFDGFCFGFATEAELDNLFTNASHRELAREDLPLFHVPTWRQAQSVAVRSFARDGYATVVRLPLRDSVALDAVRKELAELKKQSAPTLLFLQRLGTLSVSVKDRAGGLSIILSLVRNEHGFCSNPQLSIVDLGTAGKYLVAKAAIPEPLMKGAIAKGVVAKQLHPHWERWEGTGEIAMAARIDGGEISPRLYTFLPLGKQAEAPFRGFLHGSFFPTSNRKALDAKVGLNQLLIEEALSLAAQTVKWLCSTSYSTGETSDQERYFDLHTLARLAVDFLVWDDVGSLEGAIELPHEISKLVSRNFGVDSLSEAPVVPGLKVQADGTDGLAWVTPLDAKPWGITHGTFSIQAVARFGSSIGLAAIWPALGEHRLKALDDFLEITAAAYAARPEGAQVGGLAEKVAFALLSQFGPKDLIWNKYYIDLSSLLSIYPAQLSGRQVLLCNDGSLRATASQHATDNKRQTNSPRRRGIKRQGQLSIFSPAARKTGAGQQPKGDASEEFNPPASLADNFAFLSNHLDWHGELSPMRSIFENNKLVLPFDSETLLSQLSNVVRLDERKQTRFLGLRWAFQIWCRAREAGRPLQLRQSHRFYVPTADDEFLEAKETFFSKTWGDAALGREVERLIDAEICTSAEFGELRARLIAPTTHKIFASRQPALWSTFLDELGVRRGLHPTERKLNGTVISHELNSFAFCGRIGLSPDCTVRWKNDVLRRLPPGGRPAERGGEYVVEGKIWTFPGQANYESFSSEGRELYAILIANWLGTSSSNHWELSVRHSYFSNADHRQWPTPLASFLRSAKWVPVEQPRNGEIRRDYVAPENLWLSNIHKGERAPIFLRRPIQRLGRLFERMPEEKVAELSRRIQLRHIDDPTTLLYQVAYLANQFFIGAVERYYDRQFINLYNRAWHTLGAQWRVNPKKPDVIPNFLVVRTNNGIKAIDVSNRATRPSIYVRDQQDDLISNLVALDGNFLFDVGPHDAQQIGALLSALYPDMIKLGSTVSCELVVDGVALSDITGLVTASAQVGWLPSMIAIAMESLSGTEAQRLPADRSEVLQRLERASFLFARCVNFRIDEKHVTASPTLPRAICVKRSEKTFVIVQVTEESPTWLDLEQALPALCEAIDLPHLFPYLRLLVRELLRTAEVLAGPEDIDSALDFLGASLGLSAQAIAAARDVVGGDVKRHFKLIRVIIHLEGGHESLALLDDEAPATDFHSNAWQELLGRCLSNSPIKVHQLIDACSGAVTSADVRERLQLDFYAFNVSLLATGQSPDTYPELHERHLKGYLSEHEVEIINCLRNFCAPTLAKGIPAPEYARLKSELSELKPDPDWLLHFKEIPEEVLEQTLHMWLAAIGAPPLKSNPYKLASLESVRFSNAAAVRELAAAAGPLVRAWCSIGNFEVPAMWKDSDSSVVILRASLEAAGAFDYQAFTPASLLNWIAVIEAWPEGMPLSLDRETLGVTSTDVERARQKAQKEKEQLEIQRRSVPFNGRPVDPRTVDWHALGTELKSGLTKQMLSTPISAGGNFAVAQKGIGSGQATIAGKKGPPPSRTLRPPSEKTDLIGRLGEFAVFYWLKKVLPQQDIDKAWVSCNRRFLLDEDGNDGLGYDFTIGYRNQRWQIEVKASLDDPQSFEMGETEVRAARSAARLRSGTKYVIAYVRYVGTPSLTSVELLPNPMTEEGEAVLAIIGEGIRYKFRRLKSAAG